jgi:hypothetical protein
LTGLYEGSIPGQADVCGFCIGCEIVHPDIRRRAAANNNRKLIFGDRPFNAVISDFISYFQILTSH